MYSMKWMTWVNMMHVVNFREAREGFKDILDQAAKGEVVEISRRGKESAVLISKSEYERYRAAQLAAEFDDLFSTFDKTNKALSDR
jgi:antitoxin Phd